MSAELDLYTAFWLTMVKRLVIGAACALVPIYLLLIAIWRKL